MSVPSPTAAVLDYEDGVDRRHRSRLSFQRAADATWQCTLFIAGCAFVAGLMTDRNSNERVYAILIIFSAAIVYVIARIVRDDIGRAASIHMLLSGVPAVVLGSILLTGFVTSLRQYGLKSLQYAMNDAGPVPVMAFVVLLAWFIIARVYGAAAYQESKMRFR